jgi:hypothetical protein
MVDSNRHIPLLLWPFYAIWRLLSLILELLGRLLCAVTGIVLMAAGVAVSLSIVGAIVGIPLASFGFLLLVRSMF